MLEVLSTQQNTITELYQSQYPNVCVLQSRTGQLGYFIIKPALPRILCVKIQEVAALK